MSGYGLPHAAQPSQGLRTAVCASRLLAPADERLARSPTARKLSFGLFVAHPERLTPVLLRGCGHVPTYDDPDQVASVLLVVGSRT